MPARYRELVIAAVVASQGGFSDGATEHLKLAKQAGASPGEIDHLFCLVAAYAGYPNALEAARAWQLCQCAEKDEVTTSGTVE